MLGFNTGSVGIAVIGDGDTKGLTDAARTALPLVSPRRLSAATTDLRERLPEVQRERGTAEPTTR